MSPKPVREERVPVAVTLRGPLSFCLGPEGTFAVTDELGHAVHLLDATGRPVWSYTALNTPESLQYPTDICFEDGRFWITDRYHHRVVGLDAAGRFTGSFGSFGEKAGELQEPFGIAAAGEGRVWVSDSAHSRVSLWTTGGVFLRAMGEAGPGAEYYASDLFKQQAVYARWVRQQSRYHTLESSFFQSGFQLGDLDMPRGVAVKPGADAVAVADLAGRLQCFDVEGNLRSSVYPLPLCQWVTPLRDGFLVSLELQSALWEVRPGAAPEICLESPRDIGRVVVVNEATWMYLSPWEKNFYRVSW